MSQSEPTQTRAPLGLNQILIGVVVVLVLGFIFFGSTQREQSLQSSPSGTNGLQIWLRSNGLNAISFNGGWGLNAEEIGLLILPLYDTDLTAFRDVPEDALELVMQQDEYDVFVNSVAPRLSHVQGLVVLPKWRSGMRLLGIGHPELLNEQSRVEAQLGQIVAVDDAELFYSDSAFTRFDTDWTGEDLAIQIYAAQLFRSEDCRPIIGNADGMILGECPVEKAPGPGDQETVYVLSDPDLLNNHGLALGDNAYFMRDFVREVAGDGQVIIDHSTTSWIVHSPTGGSTRERTWSDLWRFFSPPFTLMWAGLGIAFLLVLWRGAFRFGPVSAGARNLIAASKIKAIEARARLMRLTDRDGALVVEYARARLAVTASRLVGAVHARHIASPEAFLGYTERRQPQHVTALTQALNAVRALPPGAGAAQAMAAADELDRVLEQIAHDT